MVCSVFFEIQLRWSVALRIHVTRSTRLSCRARAAPRLAVVVVLPTPPLLVCHGDDDGHESGTPMRQLFQTDAEKRSTAARTVSTTGSSAGGLERLI